MQEWLNHTLTEEERLAFDRDGYFLLKNALPPDMLNRVLATIDQMDTDYRAEDGVKENARLNMHGLIGKDDLFMELMDWPQTFAKVFGIMGWNIQLFHTQLVVTPPGGGNKGKKRLGWHQDNNRMNRDFETPIDTHPRVSMKVAFFLTDTTEVGRANFYIVPGGHLKDKVVFASEDDEMPEGALAAQVKAGDALFFDRRLWHAASPNMSDHPRKVLFYGYSYRWLRTKSDMDLTYLYDSMNPIRRQLLGYATGAGGRFAPKDEDVPLREWIEESLGEEAVRA
jgi:ectoine hydroxylase-related dioxygenase (phytanoyl-CoA dioxygenase family)